MQPPPHQPPAPQPASTPALGTTIAEALNACRGGNRPDWARLVDIGGILQEDKSLELILLSIGRGMLNAKRPDAALQYLDACEALFPENPQTRYYRALTLLNLGHYAPALEVFETQRPSNWRPQQVLNGMSKTLLCCIDETGDDSDHALEAQFIAVMQELVSIDDGTVAYAPDVCLRLAYFGEVDLALTVADHLIARNPKKPHGRINKSSILIEQGRYEEGLALSREVLQIWPGNKEAQSLVTAFPNSQDYGSLVLARMARGWTGRPSEL